MSFVHYSIVGHFNPDDLESISPRHAPIPTRAIDGDRFAEVLASYGEQVARCVRLSDGYAYCEWSSDRSRRTSEFAERLADLEGAIILESPFNYVRYPPAAAQRFQAAIESWQASQDRAFYEAAEVKPPLTEESPE